MTRALTLLVLTTTTACDGGDVSCSFGVFPPPGATSVPLDAQPTLTFSGWFSTHFGQVKDAVTLTDLTTGERVEVTTELLKDPARVRLTPVGGLKPDHRYRLQGVDMSQAELWHQTTGAADLVYDHRRSDSTFTTSTTPGLVAADALTWLSPRFLDTGETDSAYTSETIRLLFSEPMDLASLQGALRVNAYQGGWMDVTRPLRAVPDRPREVEVGLEGGAVREVTVAGTARSAAGVPLGTVAMVQVQRPYDETMLFYDRSGDGQCLSSPGF